MDEISDMLTFIHNKSGGLFFAQQAATQTLTTSTDTAITFTTEYIDRDGGHSTSSNTARYVGQTVMGCIVTGVVNYAANVTGQRQCFVRFNGSTTVSSHVENATGSGSHRINAPIAFLYYNGTTDYTEICGRQSSGGNLDTATADGSSQHLVIALAA
jgi:hypothetical protein